MSFVQGTPIPNETVVYHAIHGDFYDEDNQRSDAGGYTRQLRPLYPREGQTRKLENGISVLASDHPLTKEAISNETGIPDQAIKGYDRMTVASILEYGRSIKVEFNVVFTPGRSNMHCTILGFPDPTGGSAAESKADDFATAFIDQVEMETEIFGLG